MTSLEISKSLRTTGIVVFLAAGVAGGAIGWRWVAVPPATPPRHSAEIRETATASGWTINGQPASNSVTLRPGEKLEILINLRPANTGGKGTREAWSPQGPWVAGKDPLDVWVRFAQEDVRSDLERTQNVCRLEKRRPKLPNEPHFGRGVAPFRTGEYELQVVVRKRKYRGFGVDLWTGGDVVAVTRVHISAVSAE